MLRHFVPNGARHDRKRFGGALLARPTFLALPANLWALLARPTFLALPANLWALQARPLQKAVPTRVRFRSPSLSSCRRVATMRLASAGAGFGSADSAERCIKEY